LHRGRLWPAAGVRGDHQYRHLDHGRDHDQHGRHAGRGALPGPGLGRRLTPAGRSREGRLHRLPRDLLSSKPHERGQGPMVSANLNTKPPATELGSLLRYWRDLRGTSQLDLSLDAGVSQRHISFIESGRSAPSRQMLMDIAQALDIPLRDRNGLLLAAGYA